MYSEKIMNEFYNPERYGVIRGANGVGKITCDIGSEIIKVYLSVENEKIVDCQFQAFGGVVAIALSSLATNFIFGKTLKEASKLDSVTLTNLAGEVPEEKMYLVQAVVSCVHTAIDNFYKKGSKNID